MARDCYSRWTWPLFPWFSSCSSAHVTHSFTWKLSARFLLAARGGSASALASVAPDTKLNYVRRDVFRIGILVQNQFQYNFLSVRSFGFSYFSDIKPWRRGGQAAVGGELNSIYLAIRKHFFSLFCRALSLSNEDFFKFCRWMGKWTTQHKSKVPARRMLPCKR
jgi:hypothetical protein